MPDDRDYPTRGTFNGEPVPNLDELPYVRWVKVLAPLSRGTRARAFLLASERAAGPEGGAARDELDRLDQIRIEATGTVSWPIPDIRGKPSESRQISLRFPGDQYAELQQAAGVRGLKPTQLARMLIRGGVTRILYEARRDA